MKPIINYMSAAALVLLVLSSVANAEIAVIANPENSQNSLTIKQVKKIFLGKKSTFPNGEAVEPVDQIETSASRKFFYENVIKKDPATLKSYWTKMVFSGKAAPPETMKDDNAIKTWIASSKEGIGYINKNAVDNSVKVLFTHQ